MVFPKPGMEYRYKYKLPDHIQRKQKRSNRDHSKIYEMLSDDDLLDIRGAGLRKLDDEEAALFDKQKEENEKMKEADNKIKNVLPTTTTKKKERNSLMCALKDDEKRTPKIEVEVRNNKKTLSGVIKREINEDVKNVTQVTCEKMIAPVIMDDDIYTRVKRRKAVEIERYGIGHAKDGTSPVLTKKTLSSNDGSPKENDGAKRKSKRKTGNSKNVASAADLQLKAGSRRVNKAAGGKSSKRQVKKKRKYVKAKDQTHPALVDLMSNGKIKIRLSALHAYCATAHWFISNQLQSRRLRSRMLRSSFFRRSPPPSSSSNRPGDIQRKKRGPYKKRIGSSSNLKSQQIEKQATTQQQSLTPKQALRRVRYKIERHFAKMPGMQYRCPKMNDKSFHIRGNDKGKKQVWVCLVCHREELDDNGDVMICCDGEKCGDWYHLRCIGVSNEKYPENMKWYCKRCMAKEVHAGKFTEEKFPLYV